MPARSSYRKVGFKAGNPGRIWGVNSPITRWYGFGKGFIPQSTPAGVNTARVEKIRSEAFGDLERGEERIAKDPMTALVEKYLTGALGSKPMTAAEKAAAISEETERFGQSYRNQMQTGKKAIARQLGGAGLETQGSMADWKAQTQARATEGLGRARAAIQTGALREERLARDAAGRLGISVASAKARSADPFTQSMAKEKFQTSLPNI